MFVNSKKIIKIMNEIAPEHLAESWDNVGLLVGNQDSEVDRILIALEATEAVVDEAVSNNIDLIICHHPLLFKPMKKITDSDPIGRLVRKLIKNDISLYAAHTNLDIVSEGTNDYLAELLELSTIQGLEKTGSNSYVKVAVYVPIDNLENVRSAMAEAGAGKIGTYSDCSFISEGRGIFKPTEGSTPHIGRLNEIEKVREAKIEVIVDKGNLGKVVSTMLKAHPYEVPAYDIWELENEIESYYLGRTGLILDKYSLKEYAKFVKDKLNVENLRFVGDPDKRVRKVAICTGAGADVMKTAAKKGCDLLITGDLKYHEAQTALQMNLAVIDAGHYETEQIFVKRLSDKLRRAVEFKEYEVAIIESSSELNPFQGL